MIALMADCSDVYCQLGCPSGGSVAEGETTNSTNPKNLVFVVSPSKCSDKFLSDTKIGCLPLHQAFLFAHLCICFEVNYS